MRFAVFLVGTVAAAWVWLRRAAKSRQPKPSSYGDRSTGFVHAPNASDTPPAFKASGPLPTCGVTGVLAASKAGGFDPEAGASDSIGSCTVPAIATEDTAKPALERLILDAGPVSLSPGCGIEVTHDEQAAKPEADTTGSNRKALTEPVFAIEQAESAGITAETGALLPAHQRERSPLIELAQPPLATAEAEAAAATDQAANITDERESSPAIEMAQRPVAAVDAQGPAASVSGAEFSGGQNNGHSTDIAVLEAIVLHGGRTIAAKPGSTPSGEALAPDATAVSSSQNGTVNNFDLEQTSIRPDGSNFGTRAKVQSDASKKSTRRAVLRHEGKKKRSSPPKYQASIRTPDILTSPRESRTPTAQDLARTRALSIAVHVTVGRRNRYQVSLLPERSDGLPESITVRGPRGVEGWNAQQEEWYTGLIPVGLESILREGAQWGAGDEENGLRWTLARGREIYVLAARPENGVHGFVTTPRLLLNENQLVLCTKEREPYVRQALTDAGCLNPRSFSEDAGVPLGWVLFTEVRPNAAVPHDPAAGIFNILRPLHEVEIELRGGIRVERKKWLSGHPPQLRLRGEPDDLEVTIDQTIASRDALGSYTIPGWADVGTIHRVFCGGATASYEIVPPPENWDLFPAFKYETTGLRSQVITVCGPFVRAAGQHETVLLHRSSRTCLLGAVPGEIAFVDASLDARSPALLAAADFPIVWAVPAIPLLANKEADTIQLVRYHSLESLDRSSKPRVKLWAQLVMDAVYKRLRIEPETDDARRLWAEYKRAARQIKKELP